MSLMDVGCDFRGVSRGPETRRIAVTVGRNVLSMDDADDILCGQRVTVQLMLGDVAEGSQSLPGMGDQAMVADIKSLSMKPDEWSFGLTFSANDVDPITLDKLSGNPGRMVVVASGEIPAKSGKCGDDEDDEETYDDHEDVGPRPKQIENRQLPLDEREARQVEGKERPVGDLEEFGLSANACGELARLIGKTCGEVWNAQVATPQWWDVLQWGTRTKGKFAAAWKQFADRWALADIEQARRVDAAHADGVQACRSGKMIGENPYRDPELMQAWLDGFSEGDDEGESADVCDEHAVGSEVEVAD